MLLALLKTLHATSSADGTSGSSASSAPRGRAVSRAPLASLAMHLLDDALRLSIFERLSARDLASVSGVSREWRRLGRDEHLWRALVAASPPALVPRCETSSSRHLFVLNEAWRLGRFRRLGRWRAPATRVFDLAFRPPPPRPRATTTGDDDDGPRPRGGAALALVLDGVVRHVDLPPSPPPTDAPPLEPRSVRLEDRSPAGVDRTTRAAFLDPPRTSAAAGTSRGELFVCPAADATPRRVATMGGAVTALAAAPERSLGASVRSLGASVHSLLAVATSAPEANVLSILRVYEDDDAEDDEEDDAEDEDEDEDAPSDVVSSRRRPSERSLEPSRVGARGRSRRSSPPTPRPRASARAGAPPRRRHRGVLRAGRRARRRRRRTGSNASLLLLRRRPPLPRRHEPRRRLVRLRGRRRARRAPRVRRLARGRVRVPVRAVAHVPSTRAFLRVVRPRARGRATRAGAWPSTPASTARASRRSTSAAPAAARGGSWSSRRASPCALHADASKVVCVADGRRRVRDEEWTPASRGELFLGGTEPSPRNRRGGGAGGDARGGVGGGEIVAVGRGGRRAGAGARGGGARRRVGGSGESAVGIVGLRTVERGNGRSRSTSLPARGGGTLVGARGVRVKVPLVS